jgi:DNA (cytosine-5)-methyltransferase 1
MLDLFSGIGGFSLAASWTGGIETVAFCEIEPYCQKVLHKHWPDVPIYPDIKQLRGEDIGSVDIVCGGFPCQPFSCAGKQRGKEDDRYLWPEMFRVIQETKPAWVVGENVAGLIELGLEDCFFNLEAEGYEVQALIIPACGVGAPHRRNRVWIVGYSKHNGLSSTEINRSTIKTGNNYQEGQNQASEFKRTGRPGGGEDVADTESERLQGKRAEREQVAEAHGGKGLSLCGCSYGNQWAVEPDVGRVAHGVPDRIHRIKALGNAIVPQVVYPILQGIVDIENN